MRVRVPPPLRFLGLVGLFAPGGAEAACPFTATPSELAGLLARAEAAWADGDADRFRDAVDEALIVLPCVDAPLSPGLAARVHRVEGIERFLAADVDRAAEAFGAARALAPGPLDIAPAGHAVLGVYDGAPAPTGQLPAPPPSEGAVLFDGGGADRPGGVATVFQRVDVGGAVVETAYLFAADALPAYPSRALPTAPPPTPRRGPNGPVLVASAGLGAAAVGLYVGAAVVRADYLRWDDSSGPDDFTRLENENHALVIASGAAAALAGVGVGVSFALGAR